MTYEHLLLKSYSFGAILTHLCCTGLQAQALNALCTKSIYISVHSFHLCSQYDAILTMYVCNQLLLLSIRLLVEGFCVPVQAGQIYRFSNIRMR